MNTFEKLYEAVKAIPKGYGRPWLLEAEGIVFDADGTIDLAAEKTENRRIS